MAPSETTDTLRLVDLDEVEVTASVKETGLIRQQPMSATRLGSQLMASHQVTSLKGASNLAPNFFIPDYGSRLTSAIYIRGIGSRINTPAVGLYVDDIPYLDKSAFDFNFYDIERVDILRGPQGTLYGRNTMGGLVRITTRNPFYHEGTDVRLSYSTGDNRRMASLTHYHRISDQLAFSAGGYYEGKSGFFENQTTGEKVDGLQSGGGRVRAIYRPSERLSFDLNASYDYSDEGAYPYYYMGSTTADEAYPELLDKISNNRESRYRRSLLNVGLNIGYQGEGWQLNAITGYQGIRDRMFMDQDFIAADIYTLEQKQRIHTWTEEIVLKNRTEGRWQWLTGLNLMCQSLHTEAPVTFYRDGLDWLTGNINSAMPDIGQIQMLQLMGFEGMAVNFRGNELLMSGTYETPLFSAALFHQSSLRLTDQLSATLGLRLDYEHQRLDYDSPADVLYGFAMPNSTNVKMAVDLQELESHIGYQGSRTNDRCRLLPKVALKYEFDRDNNLYTSFSMGQRSGGYNLQMFSDLLQGALRVDMMEGIKVGVGEYLDYLVANNPNIPKQIPDPDNAGSVVPLPEYVRRVMAQNMPQFQVPEPDQVVYKPEYSCNWEVGTHLSLCDRRLSLDAALFYNRIYDQQIARFAPSGLGRMMVNAGKSQSCGAEWSSVWRPSEHLAVGLNYGFTHASFLAYDDHSGHDYTGCYVPFVPRHTLDGDVAYTFLFNHPSVRSLTLGTSCTGAGRIYWTESNLWADGSDASQPFYAQLNARASLVTSHFTLTLWGKNLTSSHYNSFVFESASRRFEQRCKPLHFGADLSLSF